MKDPRAGNTPPLCVTLLSPTNPLLGYCADAVCSLAVQTRREAELAHTSGLFGLTVLQQLRKDHQPGVNCHTASQFPGVSGVLAG